MSNEALLVADDPDEVMSGMSEFVCDALNQELLDDKAYRSPSVVASNVEKAVNDTVLRAYPSLYAFGEFDSPDIFVLTVKARAYVQSTTVH